MDRWIDGWIVRQTVRQKHRQTDRQTGTYRYLLSLSVDDVLRPDKAAELLHHSVQIQLQPMEQGYVCMRLFCLCVLCLCA
jgi:hypothetical protein